MANKSGIHIKKSKEGSFTKAAKKSGDTVQEKATAVLKDPDASSAMKKKAVFAKNAAKWNKGDKK